MASAVAYSSFFVLFVVCLIFGMIRVHVIVPQQSISRIHPDLGPSGNYRQCPNALCGVADARRGFVFPKTKNTSPKLQPALTTTELGYGTTNADTGVGVGMKRRNSKN